MPGAVEVTLPDDREVRVTRVFDAPASLIFDCHTRPQLVQQWMLGPPGWTMPVCEIDLRVGGAYHYIWRSDTDGSEFGFRGQYHEIDPPRRLVHMEHMDGDEGWDALCTLELVEEDGRTTVIQSMRYASREARDAALQTGMTDGMALSYDRLEELVSREAVA